MSLTNPNKVVTEERLSEFYGQILPYMGGMPDVLANKFSKGDLYSTDEKMIGQWTDGKPLYQMTLSFTLPSVKEGTVADLSAYHIDTFILKNGFFIVDNVFCPLIYANTNYTAAITYNKQTSLLWSLLSQNSFYAKPCIITIQYTKTTDSPISIGSDTDYSTDEKIVGTWIDGKPIWQKTLTGNTGSVTDGTAKIIDLGLIDSNADKNFIISAFLLSSGGDISCLSYIQPVQRNRVIQVYCYNKHGYIRLDYKDFENSDVYMTVQYTKTTD